MQLFFAVAPSKICRLGARHSHHQRLAHLLETKCPGQDDTRSQRRIEGPDTKSTGSYTPGLAEGIIQALGHAEPSSAHVPISQAVSHVLGEWAAATPGASFWGRCPG